jgi:predicted P-loop ATPase
MSSTPNPLLAAALEYAARGWPVMPLHAVQKVTGGPSVCDCRRADCDSPAKHPRTRDGLKSASTDPKVIIRWWDMWPTSNVGIRTGEIGPDRFLSVLDVDPRSGGDESLSALVSANGPLPETMVSLTGGGGQHYVFEGTTPIKTTSHRLGRGLDTRGGGGAFGSGYIVAPPSAHISGRTYEWEVSSPATPTAPPSWLAMLANASVAAPGPTSDGATIGDGQTGGSGRKRTLHSMGRTMRARGMTENEIFAALAVVNAARCLPPLDEKDVRRVAEHAARVAPGRSPEYESRRLRVVRPGDGAELGIREPGEDDDESAWKQQLVLTKDGAVRSSFGNLCVLLRHSPAWKGRFSYNEQALRPVIDGRALLDGDMGRIREQIERLYGITPGPEPLSQAVLTIAQERPFHPLRNFLDKLPKWDGVPRIERVLREILCAPSISPETDALMSRMLRAWFVALIARARNPGCKVDTVLVLVGPQGAKKSTFFAEMAGEWFSDSHMDLANKDSYMQLTETWIYEWGEIERMTARRGNEEIKSFLTSRFDTFRPPYAKNIMRVPRACLIVGTTNKQEFLTDPTGSRRFWIGRVGRHVNIALLREWRPQLLAEAQAAWEAGEPWWLDEHEDAAREHAADAHVQADSWQEAVAEWLVNRTPGPITAKRVLSGALRIDVKDHTPERMQRVAVVMRSLGYEQHRVRLPGTTHSKQRVWLEVGREHDLGGPIGSASDDAPDGDDE